MTRKWRELVAIQVVFSKVTEIYQLVHYYRTVTPEVKTRALSMEGYEMARHSPVKDITDSLRNAYAPATLSIWKQDEAASESELLQFQPGGRPDELGLQGDWGMWAEL